MAAKLQLSRRQWTTVVVAAGAACAGGLRSLLTDEIPFESVYQRYVRCFEKLATDDEARKTLEFFKKHRRRGRIYGGDVQPCEKLDAHKHFLTAVVDPVEHPETFAELDATGEAIFRNSTKPPSLLLRNVDIHPLWAGAILAHEAIHVQQWLSGFEKSREDGYWHGERDAYVFELRLLDRATAGHLSKAVNELRQQIKGGARGVPSLRDWNKIALQFGPPSSHHDLSIRRTILKIALGFATLHEQMSSGKHLIEAQVRFVRAFHQL